MNISPSSKLKFESVIFNLSEGNPGAIRVLIDSMIVGPKIDPDNFAGPLGFILNLQSVGISGHFIWCLYKDVCGENLSEAIAMVRAVQLGIIGIDELIRRIANHDSSSLGPIFQKVQEELPNFRFDVET
jgi:hypothetical protein